MAAFNYPRIASTAQRLLERFGQEIIFKRKEAGAYNPATGKVEYGFLGERWSEYPIWAVVLQYDLVDVDNTLILADDVRVMLSPLLPFKPAQSDVIMLPVIEEGQVMGYEDYEVVKGLTYAPAGVPVLYEAQARKD